MKLSTILNIGVIVIILLSITWWFFSIQEEKDTDYIPIEKNEEKPDEITEKTEEVSYAKLLGLDYDLLRSETKEEKTGLDTSHYMDIQIEKPLSKEQFSALGKEVYSVLTTNLKNKENITSIYINAFASKEAYELSKTEDYGEAHIDGLVQTFHSSHIQGNKANLKTYTVIYSPVDVIPTADSLDFEVKDADISKDKKLVNTDIVLDDGTAIQLESMVKSLVEMIKESNKGSEQVSLKIYNSNENYENGKIKYEYSTLQPSVLFEQVNITF